MTAGLPVTRSLVRCLLTLSLLGAVLVGCGGDEEQPAAASAAPPPQQPPPAGGTNRSPSIAGTPQGTVLAGVAYSFSPSATDADGDSLTYSITGRPTWAAFSTTTGQLSGTPTAGDVGTYSNIVITVSDGSVSTSLAAFSLTVVATATGSVTLSWTPPTQNTDGSPLTNLAGYRIYWGTSQGNLVNSVTVNNAGLSSYVVDQLTPATWYFATTALSSQGVESAFSNVASKAIL